MYSFGVLLHEVCTQETPVRGRMRPIQCAPLYSARNLKPCTPDP